MKEIIMKALRLASLILVPVTTVIVSYWIMEHESFEEVVRTALTCIFFICMCFMWLATFASKYEE